VLGHYNSESPQQGGGLTKHSPLSGGVVVHAEPGDCVFWNGDCIHRGANRAGVERRTLACSYDAWDERQTVEAVAKRGGKLTQQANWRWRCEERVGESMPSEFLKQAWARWRLCQPHANPQWDLGSS
jgi:ectoine hydroxylase-related dioxygenase (phytanoyl-CoA dioxygenase family)